jgi:hypothetical protein
MRTTDQPAPKRTIAFSLEVPQVIVQIIIGVAVAGPA